MLVWKTKNRILKKDYTHTPININTGWFKIDLIAINSWTAENGNKNKKYANQVELSVMTVVFQSTYAYKNAKVSYL